MIFGDRGEAMIRALFIVIGVLAALLTGVIVLFTFGGLLAILATVLVLAFGVYAAHPQAKAQPVLRGSVVALLVLSLVMVVYGSTTLVSAFTSTSGPVDPADAQALASANDKLDEHAGDKAAFRLELTEAELTALLQDGLAEAGAPFRRVMIDVVGAGHEDGYVEFSATFRNGDLAMHGWFDVVLEAGALRVEVFDVDLGAINVPRLAEGVVEDLIDPFANRALMESGAEIQSVRLVGDRVVVVGTQVGGTMLSSATLLSGLRQHATSASEVKHPPERLGRGVVNGREATGNSYYLALGDSLAANVGVTAPRDGYVSRFHNQLQLQDEVQYGLRNLAVAGETSASLIRQGQLDAALQFIRSHDVRYITINIGANDLLGHLGSADCSEGLSAPSCRERIVDAFAAYEENLQRIFKPLRKAAPDATVIFLQTYNPFSLGFGARLEAQTNRTLGEFNALAAHLAQSHELLVADGFTPMKGTAAVTTHIFDQPPDIHPRAIGFDLLAAALLDALP